MHQYARNVPDEKQSLVTLLKSSENAEALMNPGVHSFVRDLFIRLLADRNSY